MLVSPIFFLIRSILSRSPKWTHCFNLCSSCEEQLEVPEGDDDGACFNTCSSCEEQRQSKLAFPVVNVVSIHAPLARSNALDGKMNVVSGAFQYMLLLRGATLLFARACELNVVSIHAPLARSNAHAP